MGAVPQPPSRRSCWCRATSATSRTHSWGGRYVLRQPASKTRPVWTQGGDSFMRTKSVDTVGGQAWVQARIWKWREAFQNDFAARMDWTVQPYARPNHPPKVMVNGMGRTDPTSILARTGSSWHSMRAPAAIPITSPSIFTGLLIPKTVSAVLHPAQKYESRVRSPASRHHRDGALCSAVAAVATLPQDLFRTFYPGGQRSQPTVLDPLLPRHFGDSR